MLSDALEALQNAGKSYGDAFKLLAIVIPLGGTMHSWAVPKLADRFGEKGPAVIIKDMKLVAPSRKMAGQMILAVDKIRNCKPYASVLTLIDEFGTSHIAKNGWNYTVLPMGVGQRVSLDFEIPGSIPTGKIRGILSVTHSNCLKGGEPPPTQEATAEFELR